PSYRLLAGQQPKVAPFRFADDAPRLIIGPLQHPIIRPERPEETDLKFAFAGLAGWARPPLGAASLAACFNTGVQHRNESVVADAVFGCRPLATAFKAIRQPGLIMPKANVTLLIYVRDRQGLVTLPVNRVLHACGGHQRHDGE